MPSTPEPTPLAESWFNVPAAKLPSRLSEPLDSSPSIVVDLGGRLSWALGLGALTGAIGGVAMMLAAAEVGRRVGIDVDALRTIGKAAHHLGDDPYVVGLAVSIVAGAGVGVILGALMRYTVRLVARLLTGPLLASTLWTLLHAFVFQSLAPTSIGALPFGPMVAGAAICGLVVGILPPPRRRVITEAPLF